MNKKITAAIVVVVAAVLLAAVALSGFNLNLSSQITSGKTVVQTAQENENLTRFSGALNASGLTETLNGSGPFTVFAPTDTAFEAMNQTQLDNITQDNATLAKVLRYHVVPGSLRESQLTNGLALTTLDGTNLIVVRNQTGTYVNNAKVDLADDPEANNTQASNGWLYTIDKVLVPQTIVQAINNTTELSTLNASLDRANMTDALNGSGPFTVFAPSNAAFEAADQAELDRLMASNDTSNLSRLLSYHVVPGAVVAGNGTNSTMLTTLEGNSLVLTVNETGVFVNDAMVTTSNIVGTNGVVHIIDKVLTTPKTIVQTAQENGNFTQLVAAIQAANLTTTLNGSGPFTVFAPTDAAFDALNQTVLDKLTTQDKANLTKLLTYHVVPGAVASFQLENGTVTTVEGEQLNVTVNGTTVTVGNATVIMKDIICTNGIIHVIDQVLVPPSMNLTAVAQSNTPTQSPASPGGQPVGQPTTQPTAPCPR